MNKTLFWIARHQAAQPGSDNQQQHCTRANATATLRLKHIGISISNKLHKLQKQTSTKVNPVPVHDPDILKFSGDFIVQRCIYDKIFVEIRSAVSPGYEPSCGKTPYLEMSKNPSKYS